MPKIFLISLLLIAGELYGQSLGRITMYLDSKQVSQTAKDYYYGKFKAGDDQRTHSILDSLSTTNNATRPFYLLLVSRMMLKADGALAVAISTCCKDFAEKHPNQTLMFLFDEAGRKYLDSWAKTIANELLKACEDQPYICGRSSYAIAAKKVKPVNKRYLELLYERIGFYYR